MSIWNIAKRVQDSLGLTQQEFATRLGRSLTTIRNWENRRKRPTPRNLRAMAEVAPSFAEEIQVLIREYRHKKPKSSRVSPDVRDQIIGDLDVILECAPSSIIEEVRFGLMRRAGDFRQSADAKSTPKALAPTKK